MVEQSSPPGCGPYCPVGNLKDDLTELKEKIDIMHQKQDTILVVSSDIKYIREQVREIKEKDIRDTDNIFNRLSLLEKETITKKDAGIISTIMGVIVTILSFVVQLIWRGR